MTDTDIQQYSTNSREVFSVGGHALARIFGPARVKIAAIGFNNSIVIQLVLILCFTQSASMPESPEQARDQARPYVQKGLYGPDGNWLSKRARQNQAGSTAVAAPVQP